MIKRSLKKDDEFFPLYPVTRLTTPLVDKPIFGKIYTEDKRGIKMDEELSRWT